MDLEALADDLLYRARGGEGQRILEDDLNILAHVAALRTPGAQLLFRYANIAVGSHQPEHRKRQGGLPRARFADHPKRLAGREVEIDRLHRGEAAALEPAADARQPGRVVHPDCSSPLPGDPFRAKQPRGRAGC